MKLLYQAIALVCTVFASQEALAMTNLKKVQVTDGNQVDLFFDGKISPHQIKTEFFRDVIQISLNDASVYPAKISSVSGSDLTKVFAYQYSPKLVRCRLSVKGKAEDYQNRVKVKANGKVLSITLAPDARDQITTSSAKANAAKEKSIDPEQKAILDRVLKSEPEQKSVTAKEENQKLTGGKSLPSPWKSIGVLVGVLMLLAGVMVLLKKLRGRSNGPLIGKNKGLKGMIGRLAQTKFGTQDKMIEVVATHYLGPKNSIAVVKIAGKLLVLGISNDSMNLIAQLSNENDVDAAIAESLATESALSSFDLDLGRQSSIQKSTASKGAVSAGPAVFSDILSSERAKPSSQESARARIKNRIEGMKQL